MFARGGLSVTVSSVQRSLKLSLQHFTTLRLAELKLRLKAAQQLETAFHASARPQSQLKTSHAKLFSQFDLSMEHS